MSRHVPKKFMPRFANAANRPALKSRWTLVCRVICIKRVRKIKSGKAYILSSKLIMEKIVFTSSTVRSAPSLVVSLIFPVPTSTKYSFILLEEFIQLIFLKLGPWLAVWSKLLLTASRANQCPKYKLDNIQPKHGRCVSKTGRLFTSAENLGFGIKYL